MASSANNAWIGLTPAQKAAKVKNMLIVRRKNEAALSPEERARRLAVRVEKFRQTKYAKRKNKKLEVKKNSTGPIKPEGSKVETVHIPLLYESSTPPESSPDIQKLAELIVTTWRLL